MVWAPRGPIGPGFGLPWPAGGQGGWPSRWDHFSGPSGRTAPRVPFPRVRFRPLCREGCKSSPMTQGGTQDETSPGHRAGSARNNGRKKSKGTPLRVDLEPISFGRSADQIHRFGGPVRQPPAAGSTPSTQRTSRDFSPPSRARRRACSDQPRISSSRGVPGGTRDVALSSEARRTSTWGLLVVHKALTTRDSCPRAGPCP